MKSTVSIIPFFVAFLTLTSVTAQQIGDTIEVKSLNYNSGTRDTIVSFPNNPTVTYEKIIMLYNMRCKDNLVSTGTDRNKGCGEWDYSCNTYIADPSRIDSAIYTTPEYSISGFSGNFYAYVTQPTNTYYRQIQKNVLINSTLSDTATLLGTGVLNLSNVLATAQKAGKSQYLFTASELVSAGLTVGNIDALSLFVQSNPQIAKSFRVRMKTSTKTTLSNATPDLTGFTEVYYRNSNFTSGLNRFQFYTPFYWNGTSNIIVEFSFTNSASGAPLTFKGDSLSSNNTITSFGDQELGFDGSNYIEANNYRGVRGDTTRSIEAWIKTGSVDKEIVSWGSDVGSQKFVFRLDGSGKLRVESNGGNVVGTTVLNDGQWHHVAMVQSGNNLQSINFYVDGVLDLKTALTNQTLNTGNAFKVRVSRGVNNRYWLGGIAEVRIWEGALTQTEITDWMYRSVDASHPAYTNLQLYYKLNTNSGSTILDESGNGRNGTVINSVLWSQMQGISHFKTWANSPKRPNTTFYNGNYNLTVSNDTLIDTVQNAANVVTQYQIFSKNGTSKNDSIGAVSQVNYWEAAPEKMYDENGVLITTFLVVANGNITIGNLNYFRRFATKFEIMSFVTPYGINLNMGATGKTWSFDVTDFAPFLQGDKRMTIERGGQWQEELDIRFLYIVGTPPRDVLNIQNIWPVDKKSFASISANTSFEPRNVMMDAAGSFFKIRSSITGHGQEGEFIARDHFINLDGGVKEFTWPVWKECGYNPVYPQGGTWIYDRAGWCPGMATDLKEMDITNLVTAGQSVIIDYGINSASGASDYIVNNQLVTYDAANFNLDASIVDVIVPSSKIEYERTGSLCEGPVVVLRNTGSTLMTTATILYWVNNAATPQTFAWTGYLGFMESEEVKLPVATLWDDLSGTAKNTFYAEVSAPNGGADEYQYNNKYSQQFSIPTVLVSDFYILFQTNSAGYENSYQLLNDAGTVMHSRSGMASNSTFRDTVSLPDGCYTFKVIDTDHDGISFWANSDGSGSVSFRSSMNNSLVQSFQGDFGAEINFKFTVNYPLSFEELHPISETKVYPNPAADRVTLDMPNLKNAEVSLFNSTGQMVNVSSVDHDGSRTFNTSQLARGVYFIHVNVDGKVEVHKVVLL